MALSDIGDKIPRARPQGKTAHELATFLRRYCFGAASAQPQGRLASMWGFDDIGGYGRKGVEGSASIAGLWLEALRLGYWVACNHNGYYYARTREEMESSMHRDVSQSRTYDHRAKLAWRAIGHPRHIQLRLPRAPMPRRKT